MTTYLVYFVATLVTVLAYACPFVLAFIVGKIIWERR